MEVIHYYKLPSELHCTFDVFVRFNRLYRKKLVILYSVLIV